jgi:predicted membrane protein
MEHEQNRSTRSFEMHFGSRRGSTGGQLITGLLFVVVGAGLLLDTFNILEFWPFVHTWWPSALMIIALWKLASRSGSFLGSTILFAVGALLQLGKLDIIDGFWSAFWPIVLILIGVSLIVGKKKYDRHTATSTSADGEGLPYEQDRLTSSAIFGGSSVRVTSQKFQGGEITATFGGLEIDLRGAEIDGTMAVLRSTAIFGGIELRVPPHWAVVVKGTPILGGIEDKTNRFRDTNVLGPTLVLDSTVILGGIEIST